MTHLSSFSLHLVFDAAAVFNSDVAEWDTSSVINMQSMFQSAIVFNSDIAKWSTSRVTNMEYMLRRTFAFNSDVSVWDTASATNMYRSMCYVPVSLFTLSVCTYVVFIKLTFSFLHSSYPFNFSHHYNIYSVL